MRTARAALKRLTASLLGAALLITSPGLLPYAAAAGIIGRASGKSRAPRPISLAARLPAAVGPASFGSAHRVFSPAVSNSPAGLVGSARALAASEPGGTPDSGAPKDAKVPGDQEALPLSAEQAARLSAEQQKEAGSGLLDYLLGYRTWRWGGDVTAPGGGAPEIARYLSNSLGSGQGGARAEGSHVSPPSPVSGEKLLGAQIPSKARRSGLAGWIREKIDRHLAVLPDAEGNWEFLKLTAAHFLIVTGANFNHAALIKLIRFAGTGLTGLPGQVGHPERIGHARATNQAAELISTFATGAMADRVPVRTLLVSSNLIQGALLLAVPALYYFFYHTALFFPAFLAIIIGVSLLQSPENTAGSVGLNRMLRGYGPHFANRANAVYNTVTSVAGGLGAIGAGLLIVAMNLTFGFFAGNALAFGIYGLIRLTVALVYMTLDIPRDEVVEARWELARSLKANPRVRGVSVARGGGGNPSKGEPELVVEVSGDPKETGGFPAAFKGYPIRVAVHQGLFKTLVEGLRLVDGDRFLKTYLLFSMASMTLVDPLIFSVLPRHIEQILAASSAPTFVAGLPALAAQAGLAKLAVVLKEVVSDPDFIFSLFLSAASLGTGLSSIAVAMLRDRSASDLEKLLAQAQEALRAGGLDEPGRRAAVEALRQAVADASARFRESQGDASEAAGSERALGAFQSGLVREASAKLNAAAFKDALGPAALKEIMDKTGLATGLPDWAARHHRAMAKDARRQARTGLDSLERQARWSLVLYGLGWLAYLGVFMSTGVVTSVGAMVLGLFLQGVEIVIWSSLLQRVLAQRFPESMGKMYAAMAVFQLSYAILGSLWLGNILVPALSTGAVIMLAKVAISLMAILAVIEAKVNLPASTRSVK